MVNPWPTTYDQHDHMLSSLDAPHPAGQWQTAARTDHWQNTAIQGCSCALCSATRHSFPPVWYTLEHQEPWRLCGDPAVPFENRTLQTAHNLTGNTTTENNERQATQVPNRDNAGYAPLREEVRIPEDQANAVLDRTQVFDMSVTEGLQHLARRYVNNPDSLVNVVRLEPSTSGRLQIVIILEIVEPEHILATIKTSKEGG